MNFLNNEITAYFTGIGKRLDTTTGYAKKFDILFPKYTLVVNGQDFSYSGSAISLPNNLRLLRDLTGLPKNSAMYLNNNEVYLQEGRTRRVVTTFTELQAIAFSNPKVFTLSEEDMLFAFRCIIQDALVPYEFLTVGGIAKEFGYTDVDEAISVYNCCVETLRKLGKTETQLLETLEELSKIGIE